MATGIEMVSLRFHRLRVLNAVATVLLLLCPVLGRAQEGMMVTAEYRYLFGSDIPRSLARETAYERAKLEAIQKAFPGTITAVSGSLIINSDGEGSSTSFYSISESELKGEYLGDVLEPKYEFLPYDEEHDMDGVVCRVTGMVREIAWSKPQFEWQLMRNHVAERDATTDFVEGDDLYLSFTAPCNGYLAVYCVDGTAAVAQCLIPSEEQPEGIYKVKGGRRYVFFSPEHDNQDNMLPPLHDGISLYCDAAMERMQFYVLFSPNKFTRATAVTPIDKQKVGGSFFNLPPELPYKTFQKWLLGLRTRDKQLQCEKKIIQVSKR